MKNYKVTRRKPKQKFELTAQHLRAVLEYFPATGSFKWRRREGAEWAAWNKAHAGLEAGGLNDAGYVIIRIAGRLHRAHRLAYLYVTGKWPDGPVDHISGVRNANMWSNLRIVDRFENGQNLSLRGTKKNSSGHLGIHFHKTRKKYTAKIVAYGKAHHLGSFDDRDAAIAAYLDAKRTHHPAATFRP